MQEADPIRYLKLGYKNLQKPMQAYFWRKY